jgi:hypothetical protein
MADATKTEQPVAPTAPETTATPTAAATLGSATYEIIRQRLQAQGTLLRERVNQLNARRQEVFGTVEFKLLQSDRVTTIHNCIPRDMVQLGRGRFLFGFNVQFGLKKEIALEDVFAIYHRDEADGAFKESTLEVLQQKQFLTDFKRIYQVYDRAVFSKFSLIEGNLYMVFQIGAGVNDIAVCKWAFQGGQLRYLDGRAETDFRRVGFPPQYEFRWLTPSRESFRYGDHPHVSIEDRVFVECVGGDLTIKIEDNTKTGEGIHAEPVDDKFQKVDDAEIAYALIGHLILLRIRPYKETANRYFIYNEKLQAAQRVDSIGQSCVLLPEDHGLIFPDGYYLATGGLKQFESRERGMTIERVVQSPNGEDSLFVFHNYESGQYVLMPYRLIQQKVDERITCNGFSLFPDGHLLLFRADDEPQKHHSIQLRQTPFYQPGHEPAGKRDTFLYQVGNKEVVRALAETTEVLTLLDKEKPYAALYADLVKRSGAIIDTYPWLGTPDGLQIDAALKQLREVADKAVDEFDKVRRLQREAVQRVDDLKARSEERFRTVRRASFKTLDDFVHNLAALRQLRGEIITVKEVRYVNVAQLDELEKIVVAETDTLSKACVKFLLEPTALNLYRQQADEQLASVEKVSKSTEGKKIEKAAADTGAELEMLIEIVNGLEIEDATETTRIIDGITAIYSTLNQVKAAVKKRLQSLMATEGAAQFNAQMKLLSQSASSYLDLCDSPAKCEEYVNRISVQIEELEGAFADFEEYTVPLSEKRTSIYEAFEQRKVQLVEQRNRKAGALMTAAERILKTIQNRLAGFKTVEEINTYMASDLMIAKVRDTIGQLLALEDSVKADDLQGRLKSVHQDAVRQLKDRQELFVDGQSVIQLGRHKFNVNTQQLDLTIVMRDGVPNIHLTSTKYFEAITDETFLATRAVWDQEVVSENAQVYRGEYLAHSILCSLESGQGRTLDEALALKDDALLAFVQEFVATRYHEGYTKGVHDVDGARILSALLRTHAALHLARYQPTARALAVVFWLRFCPAETRTLWTAKLKGFSARNKLFPGDAAQQTYITALQKILGAFTEQTPLFPRELANEAGEYLFHELVSGDSFVVSKEGDHLATAFRQHLVVKSGEDEFNESLASLAAHPESQFDLIRDWVRGFLLGRNGEIQYLEEVTAILFCGDDLKKNVVPASTSETLAGMKGSHALIRESTYQFDYLDFRKRLLPFVKEVVPRFNQFHELKQQLLEKERKRLRLHELKPRVLGSFVRNQLVDQLYLPLVGDNLAKQIGAAGDKKRTDLMGMLLLISPPGYGKTTLLEYVAVRLGIIFIKINGPAIGHAVTSLDPQEAPNAAAREEVQKLNLALEMGDNIMLCVDDIQHCNPEFLQKFISLCDGQRKIEGIWRGQPRTYDLRGRKVVVVMAGNPYTESGQKFKIPDMLANRADTYNLGDMVSGSADWFKASYLENAVTSNAVLAPLANKSQKDVRGFIRLAAGGSRDQETFEGSYSQQEVEELLAVLKKLVKIRDVLLRVNQEYIYSAGQADEFRTEPPFRLQGSYRNMSRLTEKVVPIMNDAEVQALILDHYQNEAQTLTTGAEANLLKLREMLALLTEEEKARWEEIKRTFKRNQLSRGGDQSNPMGQMVTQLSAFQQGLEGIQNALEKQLQQTPAPVVIDVTPLGKSFDALRSSIEEKVARTPGGSGDPSQMRSLMHEMEMLHSTLATLKDLAAQQRDHLKSSQDLLQTRAQQGVVEIQLTQEMLTNERAFLEKFHEVLATAEQKPEAEPKPQSKNKQRPPGQ